MVTITDLPIRAPAKHTEHAHRTSLAERRPTRPIGTYVRDATTRLGAACDVGSAGTTKID
jgi:hypothetical protein